MTLRSLLPTLALTLALAACAKASDDPLLGDDDDDAAGGQAGTSAGSGSGGKSGASGKSGAAGKAGSGNSGQSGEGGSGGQAGGGPGGEGGTDAGQAGEGGSGGSTAGTSSGGKGGSSGTSGQGGAGQSGSAGQAGSGTAGTGAAGSTGCTPVVVINEVSNDGADGGLDEFVELYNASGCKVDLAGWTLAYYSDGATSLTSNKIEMWKAPSSQPLADKGYLVLAGSSFKGTKDAALSSGLGKSGAGLALFDASNTVVDRVAWGTANSSHPCIEGTKLAAISSNMSAARSPDGHDTDDNAADFKNNVARTPGKANQ